MDFNSFSKWFIPLKVTEHYILLSDIVLAEHLPLSHADRVFIKFISVMEEVGQTRAEV